MSNLLLEFAFTLPALLISLMFHEVAHGYIALRMGDKTAQSQGRLSLNPIKHLDRLGTLVLFLTFFSSNGAMLFGWAKPVPINPGYFRDPQRGMAWVGLAGPAANLLMAAISALILEKLLNGGGLVDAVVFRVFQLNIILMIFNLIPVPPLDGSRIVGAFMGRATYMKWLALDRYGPVMVMGVLFLLFTFPNPLYGVIHSLYRIFLPSYGF
ncbi:MAG: site-2 protease family protein [Thermoleophilia bacterium]